MLQYSKFRCLTSRFTSRFNMREHRLLFKRLYMSQFNSFSKRFELTRHDGPSFWSGNFKPYENNPCVQIKRNIQTNGTNQLTFWNKQRYTFNHLGVIDYSQLALLTRFDFNIFEFGDGAKFTYMLITKSISESDIKHLFESGIVIGKAKEDVSKYVTIAKEYKTGAFDFCSEDVYKSRYKLGEISEIVKLNVNFEYCKGGAQAMRDARHCSTENKKKKKAGGLSHSDIARTYKVINKFERIFKVELEFQRNYDPQTLSFVDDWAVSSMNLEIGPLDSNPCL